MSTVRGYHEYTGSVQYTGGYHEYTRGYHDKCREGHWDNN